MAILLKCRFFNRPYISKLYFLNLPQISALSFKDSESSGAISDQNPEQFTFSDKLTTFLSDFFCAAKIVSNHFVLQSVRTSNHPFATVPENLLGGKEKTATWPVLLLS
jgi:hypothetical protein